jgi:hypothetical protein
VNDDIRRALENFITQAAGARRVTLSKAELLPGGAIQENWLIAADNEGGAHAGPLEAVVRTDSPSAVAASHNRGQEFALLQAAFAAGVTVDAGGLSRAFLRAVNLTPYDLARLDGQLTVMERIFRAFTPD